MTTVTPSDPTMTVAEFRGRHQDISRDLTDDQVKRIIYAVDQLADIITDMILSDVQKEQSAA